MTADRPAFLPWLLWNYQKQDHLDRELVVVDASRPDPDFPPGVTVVRCRPNETVGAMRNLAVEAARGDVLTWFDDDDWQHPSKLSLLVRALDGGAPLAGPASSWFVDLGRGRARAHAAQRGLLFNGIGVRAGALARVRFDPARRRAADTAWMAAVRREAASEPVPVGQTLFFWLCHRDNLSNPARRYVFSQPLAAVRAAVGESAWGGTDEQLARLRDRLAGAVGE